MKLEPIEVQTFGGPRTISVPALGEMICFNRDVEHGDWKTAMMRPAKWPTIKKGTACKVVGWTQNLEGVHIQVEHGGSVYDVPRHCVEVSR